MTHSLAAYVCFKDSPAYLLDPLLQHIGSQLRMGLLLVSETMLLRAFGVGLVLNEAVVICVCENAVKYDKCGCLETILGRIAKSYIFQGVKLVSVLGNHQSKEQLIVFSRFSAILNLIK